MVGFKTCYFGVSHRNNPQSREENQTKVDDARNFRFDGRKEKGNRRDREIGESP